MFESYLQRILLLVVPVLMALTVHECAHAWVANRLGDPTARMLGRVTLNPIKHLDPIGTLALFLSGMFGWAKPVPVNPRNFANPSKGMMLVSLAGPASNLVLAALFAILYKIILAVGPQLAAGHMGLVGPLFIIVKFSVIINVSLAVFNMVPIPPLDGSKVLSHLLPSDKAFALARIEPYGFMILILLITTGMFNRFVSPVVYALVGLLTGGVA